MTACMASLKSIQASPNDTLSIGDQSVVLMGFLSLSMSHFHIFLIAMEGVSRMVNNTYSKLINIWLLDLIGGPSLSVECLRSYRLLQGPSIWGVNPQPNSLP